MVTGSRSQPEMGRDVNRSMILLLLPRGSSLLSLPVGNSPPCCFFSIALIFFLSSC